MDKKELGQFKVATLEIVFWTTALAVVFFINISSQILKVTSPVFLVLFLMALLGVLSSSLLAKITKRKNRMFFLAFIYINVFLAAALFLKGLSGWLLYYYLPAAIALTMAFLIVNRPNAIVTVFVAVCTFLLGEAFWNIHIGPNARLVFPLGFLTFYLLSLVSIFGYHFYRRDIKAREEIRSLNKKLETLDTKKSDIIANVSHELRTPLTSIENACVLLKRKVKGDQTVQASERDLFDIIDFNVNRQLRLIDILLDSAKGEREKKFSRRASVDIGAIAAQIATSMDVQGKSKGIQLHLDIQPNLPKVYASADQMAEVYTNLVGNAIKYTQAGGAVSVKVYAEENDIRSEISDTGVGIKEEDLSKIFYRFARLDSLLTHKERGVGLGLAITKEIIDAHKGKIWVESKFGKGATFIFTLPRGFRRSD